METFSPASLGKMSGLHPDTIRKSFAELEMKKYILPVKGTLAHYEFYEKFQIRDSAPRAAYRFDDTSQYSLA